MEVRNSLLNDYLSEGSRGLAEWNLFTWCVQSLILRKLQFSREVKEEMAEKIIRLAVVSDLSAISFYRWQDERKREIARKHKVLKYHGHENEPKNFVWKKGKILRLWKNSEKISFYYLWLLTLNTKLFSIRIFKFLLNIVKYSKILQ